MVKQAELLAPVPLPVVTDSLRATAAELVLIDLSSIAHPIWHMSQAEPDPNATSTATVARVRALATGHPHVAICCDSGRSFRREHVASYKANRPVQDAALQHQITLACETLVGDGFPVWSVKSFEADDIIATATMKALATESLSVLIVSSDKDLLQLVGPRVHAMSVRDGSILDAEAVVAKFGVTPEQMRDYLMLVGDASDNVKGAKGIGEKKAAELLGKYGSLDTVYATLTMRGSEFTPGLATALREFQPRLDETRMLITLRTDVDIPFEQIAGDRIPKDVAAFIPEPEEPIPEPETPATPEPPPAAVAVEAVPTNGNGHALAVVPTTSWQTELEPRNIRDAKQLSADMFASRLFSAYGTPAAILSTVMAGRELGLQAMASLRAFHIVDGKPTLAADLIRALIVRSGQAKYFRCTERTPERATFETQRGEDPPIALSYSLEEAKAAGIVKPNSGWTKNPADMCVARASSKLARLVYADVVHGLYAPEELE